MNPHGFHVMYTPPSFTPVPTHQERVQPISEVLATAQKGIRHAPDCHLSTMGTCTCPHDEAMEAMKQLRNILREKITP